MTTNHLLLTKINHLPDEKKNFILSLVDDMQTPQSTFSDLKLLLEKVFEFLTHIDQTNTAKHIEGKTVLSPPAFIPNPTPPRIGVAKGQFVIREDFDEPLGDLA